MKLNLGGGEIPIEGFVEVDRKSGQEIYPLAYGDNTAAEIRASHCLEHFSHKQVGDVLADWMRVLKPGGVLKIAVPDFAKIAQWYVEKKPGLPLQSYILGGQTDENDYHKAVFDAGLLTQCLVNAGLENIKAWKSEIADNASFDVSLNLQGTKPGILEEDDEPIKPVKIVAVATVPRLGFNATWQCTLRSMLALGIRMEMVQGVFWGACLTRGIEKAIHQGAEIVLTIDYDSVFDESHIVKMCQLLADNPDYDILVPVQMKRECEQLLFHSTESKDFSQPITPISSGHFGLTVFTAEAFQRIPKPWMFGQPNADGEWGDGRIDDDMWFWQQCAKARVKVGLVNEVRIGHLELVVNWADKYFKKVTQSISDYTANGQPDDTRGL